MSKYICNGAQCKCTLGTEEGLLDVKSQSTIFIQNKLMATENEKTFSKNFINCNRDSSHPPCTPDIKAPWTNTKSNVFQTEHKGLLEDSECICSFGGKISIKDSKQSETKNVIFGDYTSEPKEISKVYVKVRTLPDYNGEFGFDWLDVDPETTEIQKIQGVPFSDIEYFYKKGNSPQDLGDILPISDDNKPDAIKAIQENYNLINFCDYVDTPFVLLKPGEHATLSLEVFFEGDAQEDYISITGDEFYYFEIIDGEKNDKTAKKKIVENGELIKLKVKCLKESLNKNYYFVHTGARGPREVGGLSMMENKVLKLKFRVIALVSNEGNPTEKAKKLFQKFTDAGVAEYLNKNSLNQAGYEVEIENQEMFKNLNNPSIKLDDYFYAFDRKDWENKKYYKLENNTEMLFKDINIDTGKKNEKGEPIIITKSIDYVTIEEYAKKLKEKYSDGLIILTDSKCMGTTGAFSRFDPFNHYALFVYSTNIENKPTYAHEIGHMLGLNHTFYLGDEGFKEKWDGLEKYKSNIEEIEVKSGIFDLLETTTSKLLILEALDKTNIFLQNDIRHRKTDYNKAFTANGNFSFGGKPVTKAVFLEKSLAVITEKENQKNSNIQASKEFLLTKDRIYINYKKIDNSSYYILKEYILKIKKDYLKYYSFFLAKNYLLYKKGSTNNMMDYSKNQERLQRHQIKIMREDYENY
jgi:hypothetical protein